MFVIEITQAQAWGAFLSIGAMAGAIIVLKDFMFTGGGD